MPDGRSSTVVEERDDGSSSIELTSWRSTQFDNIDAELPLSSTGLSFLPPISFVQFDETIWLENDTGLKNCCFRCSRSTFLRSLVIVISLIGLACVAVGIILGILTASGTTRWTLCLLLIGVGVVLITVSGIAWRLMAFDLTSRSIDFWSMIGDRSSTGGNRSSNGISGRFRPIGPYFRVLQRRPPPTYYGVFPPNYACWPRPPPPYQPISRSRSFPSPPPTYCSTNSIRPTIVSVIQHQSHPPSYRSRESLVEIRSDESVEIRPEIGLSPKLSGPNLLTISIDQPTRVSVVDCSSADPIGFELADSTLLSSNYYL